MSSYEHKNVFTLIRRFQLFPCLLQVISLSKVDPIVHLPHPKRMLWAQACEMPARNIP